MADDIMISPELRSAMPEGLSIVIRASHAPAFPCAKQLVRVRRSV
jgi:hypothetical protein